MVILFENVQKTFFSFLLCWKYNSTYIFKNQGYLDSNKYILKILIKAHWIGLKYPNKRLQEQFCTNVTKSVMTSLERDIQFTEVWRESIKGTDMLSE